MKKPYISVEEDGTCWSDDGLICPHCHKEQHDLFEISGAYTEDGGETHCGNCGNPFTFSTYIRYSWTSRKPYDNASKGTGGI